MLVRVNEVISFEMPAFKLKGMLLYFAAHKNHIGLYPTASGIEAFKKGLSVYKGAKGSVQFPLYKPLPLYNLQYKRSLITACVRALIPLPDK